MSVLRCETNSHARKSGEGNGDDLPDQCGVAVALRSSAAGSEADVPGSAEGAGAGVQSSDLLFEIFGDKGLHSRAAVGVAALPLGASVEVLAIIELA